MTPRQRINDMISIIADGVSTLRVRDGIDVTEARAMERARNIVQGLLGLDWLADAVDPS